MSLNGYKQLNKKGHSVHIHNLKENKLKFIFNIQINEAFNSKGNISWSQVKLTEHDGH